MSDEKAETAVEQNVLARITPTPAEEAQVMATCKRLADAAGAELARLGIPGRATVQGSVAKDTWLAGGGDIDLFLLLDPGVPAERLERTALDVGRRVLSGAHTRYAQHPYLVGTFEGRTVDLVPAYAVAAAAAKMSAVDRTPFHTAWVGKSLDGAGRGQARLLKQFLKGAGAYGAQTAVGGFSGYLAEVLVVRFGGLEGVLQWLASGAQPRRLALGPDAVQDDVSRLVVVDPVDPARNCAAGVQEPTLQRACQAAKDYLAAPREGFFFPAPPRAEPASRLESALREQAACWLGVILHPKTDRLDIVLPQFQKALRTWSAGLQEAGFAVRRADLATSPDGHEILAQWVCDGGEMPATRVHRGPPDDGASNAARFRGKWQGHEQAAGPVRVGRDGNLEVEVRVAWRTAPDWLRAHVRGIPVGAHVADALGKAQVMDAVAGASAAWQPAVADLVLGRMPWER